GRLRGVGGSAGTAPDGVCGPAVGAAIAWPRHQIQPEEFRAVTDVFAPVTKSSEYADQASAAYRAALSVIERVEPRIADATRAELADQRASLKLIASENYASPAVLLTMGTWFSDKYAEGTVGHRFYAGCQNVDTVEALAA